MCSTPEDFSPSSMSLVTNARFVIDSLLDVKNINGKRGRH